MKIKIYLLFISLILSYVHSKSNGTPQGVNLKNHFGSKQQRLIIYIEHFVTLNYSHYSQRPKFERSDFRQR